MESARVREIELAFVLETIHAPPNLRDAPVEGDVEGEFDRWFDGGAIRRETNLTEYHFVGGIVASVAVSPALSVHVAFPDGREVTVAEIGPAGERPRMVTHSRQRARPARWHCGSCGERNDIDGGECAKCRAVRPYAGWDTPMQRCAGCMEYTLDSVRFCEWCGATQVDA